MLLFDYLFLVIIVICFFGVLFELIENFMMLIMVCVYVLKEGSLEYINLFGEFYEIVLNVNKGIFKILVSVKEW